MEATQQRMTEGSIWKKITFFALPIFLGNLFQQMYNTADSLIVGNFLGSNALAAAIDYIEGIGRDVISAYERELLHYATEQMLQIPGLHIYGRAAEKDAVISFNIEGIHHLDLGTLLDRLGIAIRTGHHCAQPLMDRCGTEGMARASFALYNTREEADTFVEALQRVRRMF